MTLVRSSLGTGLVLALFAAPAAAQYHRVTTALGGAQPNGIHEAADVSGDGRFVVFTSAASNLVAGDGNASADVFVRDLIAAATARMSIDEGGLERAGDSGRLSAPGAAFPQRQIDISDDGRFVVFTSRAPLAAADTATCIIGTETSATNCPDVYLRDRQAGTITRLSVGPGGVQGNGPSSAPRISGDGRFVAFQSDASNLVTGDTNNVTDVFLVDRQAGTLVRVSTATGGQQGNLPSTGPSVSDDGSVIAWASASSTLSTEPDPVVCERAPPACQRPFFTDRSTGVTRRVPMPEIATRFTIGTTEIVLRVEAGVPDVGRDGRTIALNVASDTGFRTNSSGVRISSWIFHRVTGQLAPARSAMPSWDGRRQTFADIQDGAVPTGTIGVYDHLLGLQTIVSSFNLQNEAGIFAASLSGPVVVFRTREAFTVDDTDGAADIYALDGDPDHDGMPSDWETLFGLDPASATDAAADPDGDGLTNLAEFQRGSHPRGTITRYHAEGAANAFFSTRFALANPGASAASVVLRFLGDAGQTWSSLLSIPAHEQRIVMGGGLAASFSTVVESDQPIVSDRTMSWGTDGYGSSAETSMAAPATTWFLAEGATHGRFELFYLLQNPGTLPASVNVTYLRPAPAPPLTLPYTIPAESRLTIPVDAIPDLAAADVSARIVSDVPILVERSMYMHVLTPVQIFGAGHAGAGVPATSTRWFLAEGATGAFFDLYYLLANPSTQPTQVRVTYLLPQGAPLVKEYALPAQSRLTISVENEDPLLAGTAVSAIVESLTAVGIVVERSMWWPGDGQWQEGHLAAGSTITARRWALADGFVDLATGAETYVLIANTSSTAGTATITTLPSFTGGPVVTASIPLPANSRISVPMSQYAQLTTPPGGSFGALIESDGPEIVVERAMYRNAGGIFWSAGTAALGTPLP